MNDRDRCAALPIGKWWICDEEIMQLHLNDPWKVVVASVLLQRTIRKQAEVAFKKLMALWPTAATMAKALQVDVLHAVKPCGFGERRSRYIVRLSHKWASGEWEHLADLPGVGQYVQDAVRIVCFEESECKSGDHALKGYVNERDQGVR